MVYYILMALTIALCGIFGIIGSEINTGIPLMILVPLALAMFVVFLWLNVHKNTSKTQGRIFLHNLGFFAFTSAVTTLVLTLSICVIFGIDELLSGLLFSLFFTVIFFVVMLVTTLFAMLFYVKRENKLTAKIKELATKPFAFQVLVFSMTLVFLIAANIVMLITKSNLQFLWELIILFFVAVIISAYGIVGLRKAESKLLYTTKLCARFVCLEIVFTLAYSLLTYPLMSENYSSTLLNLFWRIKDGDEISITVVFLVLQMIIVFAVMVVYGIALASKDMKNNRGDISRS